MPIDNFEDRVKALDEAFKNAKADAFSFELPDPGTYQALLRYVDFFEQKASPNCAFLKMVYEIVFDADFAGREVEMVYNLEPHKLTFDIAAIEQKLSFLKRDLRTLGVDVEAEDFSLTTLHPGSPVWDAVLDVPVEIQIKDSKKINENTGRPFRNCYLNARTGDPLPKGQMPLPASDVPVSTDFPAPEPRDVQDDESIPF